MSPTYSLSFISLSDNRSIEVSVQTWEAIIRLLEQCGFSSTPVSAVLVSGNAEIDAAEAARFAQVGTTILEESMKDPLGAYSTIRFDMGKFSEIVCLAEAGGFVIRRKGGGPR